MFRFRLLCASWLFDEGGFNLEAGILDGDILEGDILSADKI